MVTTIAKPAAGSVCVTPVSHPAAASDLAIMDAALANGRMLLQQHGVVAHDAVGPFGVDVRLIGGSPLAIEERYDPPIAIGWPLIHQPANNRHKLCVLSLVVGPRGFVLLLIRSARFERETPSVSATVFIGNRPSATRSAAISIF
jgi:hypothetical protein